METPQKTIVYPLKLDYPAELGVDWLSRSYPVARMSDGMGLGADKERLRRLCGDVDLRAASLYGYNGVRAAGSFVGRRNEGSRTRRLEILSGKSARNADLIPSRSGLKVNRIDIQATLLLDDTSYYRFEDASNRVNREIDRILKHLLWFKEVNGRNVAWLNKLKITLVKQVSSDDGMTIYVGSRSSDSFIRIYNKTAEARIVSPNSVIPALLRIEVELKDSYAELAYSYLEDCGGFNEKDDLSSLLNQFISRIGLEIEAVAFRAEWMKRVSSSRNNDRTLAWLAHTVKPSIERMFVEVGVDAVASALGSYIVEQLGLFSELKDDIFESE